jgi:hypothetical protein
MVLSPPRGAAPVIFNLQPSLPPEIERGEVAPTANLTVLLTKKNRIAIQEPTVQEYRGALDPPVISEIGLRWSNPKFLAVACTVTCMPDPACRFTFLRIEFDLGPGLSREVRPVACELHPESGQHTVQMVETAEVTANLSFKVKEIETPSIGQKQGASTTHERRYYSIVAFGRRGSKPAWDFRATPVSDEIAGDLDLLLLAASSGDVRAEARISVSADVQLRSGGLRIPFLTSRNEPDVAGLRFRLT